MDHPHRSMSIVGVWIKNVVASINLVNFLKKPKGSESISFAEGDLQLLRFHHSNAVVIMVKIGGSELGRMLVNNGSSCNIIFFDAFMKMGINLDELKPF